MTQSSGVSLDASTDIFRPLIVRLGMFAPRPVYEAAYGGISLLGLGWHPPGKCQLACRMIPNFPGGNAIWNEYKNHGCALRQGFVAGSSTERASRRTFRFRISQRRTDRARIRLGPRLRVIRLGKSQCRQSI